MKTLLFLLTTFISLSTFAEDLPPKVLFYKFNKNSSEKIEIKILNKMKVNDACASRSKECLSLLTNKAALSKNTSGLKGNPASTYCEAVKGDSIILKDEKNNEYDYCRFAGQYMVDSWDLYESAKK